MTRRERAVILGAFFVLLLFQFTYVYFEIWNNPEVAKKISPSPSATATPDPPSRGGVPQVQPVPSSVVSQAVTIAPIPPPPPPPPPPVAPTTTTRVPSHPLPRPSTSSPTIAR